MIRKPTVFLVQEPTVPKSTGKTFDLTPLYWYGKVEILIERGQSPSFRPDIALMQITQRLKDFDHENDFIAAAGGDYLGIMLVGAALANMKIDRFNFLRFERSRLPDGTRDPSRGSYVVVDTPLRLSTT